MTIGKREQIVIGSVAVIIVIALLHFFIFSRSHDQLTEVIRTDQESRSKITAMSQTTDATLDNYTSLTQTYLNEVRQGIRLLKLEQPKFFLAVTDADVTAAMPPDIPPDQQEAVRWQVFVDLVVQNLTQQRDVMIEEVEQLRQFRLREDIRMTFLGASDQGLNATVRWDIPTQMPENLRRNPGLTWDILRSVMEVKDTLDLLDQEDEQRPPLEENYHNMLRQLGLDVTHADKLKRFGEFVPFYYRLAVAELIWASKPEGQKILGRELTRDKNTPPDQFVSLYDLLGIKLPSSDMLEGLFEPNINKMYFAYEQLRTLNDMLTKAAEGNRSNDDPAFRILEVSEVYLWAFSYLRKAPEVPRQPALTFFRSRDELLDDERMEFDSDLEAMKNVETFDEYDEWASWDDWGSFDDWSMEPATPTPTPTPEMQFGDEDIGYALPIKIVFTALNKDAMTYVYEILRTYQLAELDRWEIRSSSRTRPQDQTVTMSTTFLMVPKLRETIEVVNDLLRQFDQNPGAVPPAAPAPAIP